MESDDGDPTTSGQPATPESFERLSPEAVRSLYELHGRDLLAFLVGVLRDPEAAWDVSQNTFQRLLEVGHRARAETVRGWLFKVAFHEAMAFRRKQSRGERFQRELSAGSADRVEFEAAIQSLVNQEELDSLQALLLQLPDEQQVVVRRRIHEEKTFAVIADELKVPLGTVLTRMRLAVQKLQKWFGRDDGSG